MVARSSLAGSFVFPASTVFSNGNMRLISWNANMAYRKKFGSLEILNPDIVVVQECERSFFESRNLPYVWSGKNPHKGLAVYATDSKTSVELVDMPVSRHMMPVIYKKDGIDFHILAVWSQLDPQFPYIEGMRVDLHKYMDFLRYPYSMVVGDWNSNPKLDEKYGIRKGNKGHIAFADLLLELGLHSIYHTFNNDVVAGDELHPTLFFRREKERPFHIDYCFASAGLTTAVRSVEVGAFGDWITLSDHMPLIVDFNTDAIKNMNEEIKWTFAKTYALTAPHEYVLKKDYPDFFEMMRMNIEKEGVDEQFTLFGETNWYRYIYTDTHRYWICGDVLNRDSRYGKATEV